MRRRKNYVVYNGRKDAMYSCDLPTDLVKGKMYVVQAKETYNWQTNYKLLGIEGKFNSVWFDQPTVLDKVKNFFVK